MAASRDKRMSQFCADDVREIGPEESARIWSEMNYKKHGVVAAFRTSPQKFEEYMRRRAAADQQAKHGRGPAASARRNPQG
tara:strand:- start:445 stop:687 length:243 start_codon:yes stop_codon:yes gene_type:complete